MKYSNNDAVSRQAVLALAEEIYIRGLDYRRRVIDPQKVAELPSAQQWIPTSKRLPQEDGYYYVTCNYFGMPKVYMTEWRNGDWVTFERDELTAWTEITVPKPYTG